MRKFILILLGVIVAVIISPTVFSQSRDIYFVPVKLREIIHNPMNWVVLNEYNKSSTAQDGYLWHWNDHLYIKLNGVDYQLDQQSLSDGDKGDITVSASGDTWTIDNDVVTYAKMQNISAASKLIGRGDSGSGDPQEITLGSGLTMTGTTLSSSGGISTLNTLTAATQTFATGTNGSDFNISSVTSTHTFNIPTASGTNRGALSSADWTTFNNKVSNTRTISTTSPLTGGGDLSANRTFAINDAAADGATKGAASFTAADFNSSSGNISIDYTNGQASSGSNKGFLTSADWTTFNGKLGGSGVTDRLGVWSGTGTMTSFSNVTRNSSTGAVTVDNVVLDGGSVAASTGDLTLDGPGNVVLDGSSGAWITSGPLKFTAGEIVEGASNQNVLTLALTSPLEVEFTAIDDLLGQFRVTGATIDFPSTTSLNRSTAIDITVTGATVGDHVSVAIVTGVLPLGPITAFVSATDNVKVVFDNITAAPQDPSSATYNILVTNH